MKKYGKIVVTLVFLFISICSLRLISYASSNNSVYVGGENIGIKINTGVVIIGKYEVDTADGKISPWENSNIEIGDEIISINGLKITDNKSLINVLKNIETSTTKLEILRNKTKFITNIDIVMTKNNQKSLGLYIKDKLLGVGTITFINSENGNFAALGHGIYYDNNLFARPNGVILDSNVDSIKKGIPGDAGEIRSSINSQVIGYIGKNTISGLYGKSIKEQFKNKKLMEIAEINDIKIGKATILTTLDDNVVREYDIEIIELDKQTSENIKGIKIKITDERLINKTGGIVQGMSGSPIIQDGKLVGAVSHVVVDNPIIGYGMYAKWMYNNTN